MANDRSLDKLTLKELGALALSLGMPKWSQMRKPVLIDAIREFQEKTASKSSGRGKRASTKERTAKATKKESSETGATSRREVVASEGTKRRGRRTSAKTAPTLFDMNGTASEETTVREPVKRKRRAKSASDSTIDQILEKVVEQVTEHTEQLVAGLVAELNEKQSLAEDVGGKDDKKKTRVHKGRGARATKEVESEQEFLDEGNSVAQSESAEEKETRSNIVSKSKRGANAKKKGRAQEPENVAVQEFSEETKEQKTSARRSRKTRKSSSDDLKTRDAQEILFEESESDKSITEAFKSVVESNSEESRSTRKRKGRAKKNASVEQDFADVASSAKQTREEQAFESVVEEESKRKRRSNKKSKKEETVGQATSEPDAFDSEFKPDSLEDEPLSDALETEDSDDLLVGFDSEWIEDPDEEEDELDTDDEYADEFDVEELDVEESEPEPEPELSEQSIQIRETMKLRKTIGSPSDDCDRIRLSVLDSYWLRASWQITPQLVERVRVAMGRFWHTADPILRVFSVDKESKYSSVRRDHYFDVEIRGGVNSWYVAVDNPPCSFMVELGYRSRDGQLYTLASSNIVTTPQRYVHDSFKHPALEDSGVERSRVPRRVRATLEAANAQTRSSAEAFPISPTFNQTEGVFGSEWDDGKLIVDTEIVIKGQATPGSNVSIKEEPIRLNAEGKFSVRYSLPERRHVFPVVMSSFDGAETQTIVLAIDRNTKTLEPIFKEDDDD